ncbi:MAG: helix-turn-helix domain-containing protein [Acidobacteriota bacterium]|nr:helix-turn-helix domain-containing protein [Acidobacteriota bacterium]
MSNLAAYPPSRPYLSTVEAAEFLHLSPQTLEGYRCRGGGPAYRKHGRRVVYHVDDLERWSDERRSPSTPEREVRA